MPRIPEEVEEIDDSFYSAEFDNARFLLERLYELKLERDNLELRHKRIKCRYSEAVYLHLKVSAALEVYSTFALSIDDPEREHNLNQADGISQNERLKIIFEKFDDKFENTCVKTWKKGSRGIGLLTQMKKPLKDVLYSVESLVINGRL